MEEQGDERNLVAFFHAEKGGMYESFSDKRKTECCYEHI